MKNTEDNTKEIQKIIQKIFVVIRN